MYYLAVHAEPQRLYVVKVLKDASDARAGQERQDKLDREVDALSDGSLIDTGVCPKLHGVLKPSEAPPSELHKLVMSVAPGKQLYQFICDVAEAFPEWRRDRPEDRQIWGRVEQMVGRAVRDRVGAMHSANWTHGDLSAANIFVEGDARRLLSSRRPSSWNLLLPSS